MTHNASTRKRTGNDVRDRAVSERVSGLLRLNQAFFVELRILATLDDACAGVRTLYILVCLAVPY